MGPDPAESVASLDNALSAFFAERPRLFGIAYRMLGSAADAEDIVQSAWLRWQTADRAAVASPPAFLTTMTVRLAINLAESARAQRENYIGPWIPEPVDTRADPCLGAERDEALELAVLVLLEKLTPTERAAYVLREAFNYEYARIAEILDLEEANVRQLVSRARKHIEGDRRAPASPPEQKRLLTAFIAAAQQGDTAALEAVLASDAVSYSDGGGIVRAAHKPVSGRVVVAKFVAKATLGTGFWQGVTVEWVEANTRAAALIRRDGIPAGLVAITASDQGIDRVWWLMRPSKLAALVRAYRPVTE